MVQSKFDTEFGAASTEMQVLAKGQEQNGVRAAWGKLQKASLL
jgi:hypothetical protein